MLYHGLEKRRHAWEFAASSGSPQQQQQHMEHAAIIMTAGKDPQALREDVVVFSTDPGALGYEIIPAISEVRGAGTHWPCHAHWPRPPPRPGVPTPPRPCS